MLQKRVIKKIYRTLEWNKKSGWKIDSKPGEYEKHFMKMKFNTDDNLPLNKILKLHNLTTIVRLVFQEHKKYYPQVFLDEFSYE